MELLQTIFNPETLHIHATILGIGVVLSFVVMAIQGSTQNHVRSQTQQDINIMVNTLLVMLLIAMTPSIIFFALKLVGWVWVGLWFIITGIGKAIAFVFNFLYPNVFTIDFSLESHELGKQYDQLGDAMATGIAIGIMLTLIFAILGGIFHAIGADILAIIFYILAALSFIWLAGWFIVFLVCLSWVGLAIFLGIFFLFCKA